MIIFLSVDVKKYKIIDVNENDETAGIGRMYSFRKTVLNTLILSKKNENKNARIISSNIKQK